ncbi:MAG TPA: hypothetical protein VH988_21240 [Thermoanaerobaculia bacterium]|jgi:hypothetical protein|nr:hypothetical protein [Thermoanaerobaculia bacterium]
MFTLTEAHLKLLRQGAVLWSPVESGAPATQISPAKLNDGSPEEIEADIARRAGLVVGNPPSAADRQHAKKLAEEFHEAFAQTRANGKLTGRYECANPLVDFAFAA